MTELPAANTAAANAYSVLRKNNMYPIRLYREPNHLVLHSRRMRRYLLRLTLMNPPT